MELSANQQELYEQLTRNFPKSVITCKQNLWELLAAYSDIMKICYAELDNGGLDDGCLELRYLRRTLVERIEQMNEQMNNGFILRSFERSLKHAGMMVYETTHGDKLWKRWRLRPQQKVKQPLLQEKKKKRVRREDDSDDDDDNYIPSDYQKRQKVTAVKPLPMQGRHNRQREQELMKVSFNLDDGDLPPAWRFEIYSGLGVRSFNITHF